MRAHSGDHGWTVQENQKKITLIYPCMDCMRNKKTQFYISTFCKNRQRTVETMEKVNHQNKRKEGCTYTLPLAYSMACLSLAIHSWNKNNVRVEYNLLFGTLFKHILCKRKELGVAYVQHHSCYLLGYIFGTNIISTDQYANKYSGLLQRPTLL